MWLQNKAPTSFVQLIQITTQRRLSTLLLNILNCLMDHLRFGKWTSYSFPMDKNMF